MPTPQVKFENNDKVAHAVSQYLYELRPSPHRFALRPFNRFSTAFTEWWFIPHKTEWPAYRFSKLCVHTFQSPSDGSKWLHAGFYVEHGLGKQLSGMSDVNQKHIMQPNWYWHEFVRYAQNREMESGIQEVLALSQCPLWISLSAYEFNHVPEPDMERKAPHDWLEFTIQSQDSRFQLARSSSETLAQLNTCTDLHELARRLEAFRDLDYFWVDLVIGVRLLYGSETDGTWGAAELWRNALEPWNSWIR